MTRRLLPACLLCLALCACLAGRLDLDPAAGDGEGAPARCLPGVDSDLDGLDDQRECALMTDPQRADTDGDGLSDGAELAYPRACVAIDPAAQRRPPPFCEDDAACQLGERCRGLDPREPDTDGDGAPDGAEDPLGQGKIDVASGQTDPRVPDTDGDGTPDGYGLDICRPAGLAQINVAGVPLGAVQLGHDLRLGKAVAVAGTEGRGALLLADAAAGVAAAVLSLPAAGDVRAEAARTEAALVAALGAGVTPVLTGQALRTHETLDAVTSTYLQRGGASASALRDALLAPLTGAAAPPSTPVGAGPEYLIDVTTTLRGMRRDVIVTIAPRAAYEDPAQATAIRARDLSNTTGVSETGKGLEAACQVIKAERQPMADFLWTVDTSNSMSDDQERLGRAATLFFDRLASAGIDFRVGILQAGVSPPNLEKPGFRFISGADPMGALLLCQMVTMTRCPFGGLEDLDPYEVEGTREEAIAEAILAHNVFAQNAKRGVMDPERRLREGARAIAFAVTDEPGTNDFNHYFNRAKDPDTGAPWGATYDAATLGNIISYFRRNQIMTFGLVPSLPGSCAQPSVRDLPRCVIEGNGGAVIPITTATDAEVAAAMNRIVDSVAGGVSEFRLNRSPITSTIKVSVRGVLVPRSRKEGFDYEPSSRSIVFYGTRHRPRAGEQVVISYRVWVGSLG